LSKQNGRKFGQIAEELAAKLLIKKGYTILEQNYRYSHKEIDIICRKDKTIIFVEVKAAQTEKFGAPETWVTPSKQKNIIETAQSYIQEHDTGQCDFRFDVICFIRKGNQIDSNHLQAAFYAEENP
jgi:putative endonuclease